MGEAMEGMLLEVTCDLVKQNESDVGNIDF